MMEHWTSGSSNNNSTKPWNHRIPMALQISNDPVVIPTAEIDSLQFTFMPTKEILEWSVMEVTSSKTTGGNNSIADLRLGPSNPNESCATCNQKWKICPGHFGHISLPVKVPHPLRMKNIAEFLNVFCWKCARFVMTPDQMKLCEMYEKKGEARFRAILK